MSAKDVELLVSLQERGFDVLAGETKQKRKSSSSEEEKEQDKSLTLEVVLDRLRSLGTEKDIDEYAQKLDKQISESGQSQTEQLLKTAENLQKYAKWLDQVSGVLKDLRVEDNDEEELC